jgi:small subunit ribosomal protein S4
MHTIHRGKPTSYALMLREKQKVKRSYGLLEKQFRSLFEKAERQKGVTGGNLLVLLERRLDNVVFRLGFANSRTQARQLVSHGHFKVNGRKVDIPSYLVKAGDEVAVKERSAKMAVIKGSMETVGRRGVPAWLELDKDAFAGKLKALPTREDLSPTINEQLIVELYSK